MTRARTWFFRAALWLATAFFQPAGARAAVDAARIEIARGSDTGARVALAAAELRRYIYLRTGELCQITTAPGATREEIVLERDGRLADGEYQIHAETTGGRSRTTIAGGSDLGILYGAYRYIERLGVRFYLHGDTIPDDPIGALPKVNEDGKPLFSIRGILPFHDFPEGPDWWNLDDYLAALSQLPKLRMNFIGLHCYPENEIFGPEAAVWIGLPEDVDATGRARFSYSAFWANTVKGVATSYAPMKTSEFTGGAAELFPGDDYGPDVMRRLMPRPATEEQANELFNRVGELFRRATAQARGLGIKTCVGTSTPLNIPKALRERLRKLGRNPDDPAAVKELYKGTFQRIARLYPVDYYWLWTPEDWTWSGDQPGQFAATARDIQSALEALREVGNPFTLATSGWVLGPRRDRAALDAILPKNCPMSCISRRVGHDAIDPAFANIAGRPKWAIPWLENDPQLTQPQPWAARMRYDAADAKRLGCDGLVGIHWRTKAMAQNVAALAAAAWGQSWTPASYDASPAKPRPPNDGAFDGVPAAFAEPVAGADEPPVYQKIRANVSGYILTVPDGVYTVTLKFNEPIYDHPGGRVFGVSMQGKRAIAKLDIFARAGKNRALDLAVKDVRVSNGELRIYFTKQTGPPCVSGIVIEGRTSPGNQIEGHPFVRKINCGGGVLKDYEADRIAAAFATAGKDRAMPVADFYLDFARANFGETAARDAGAIMATIDGVKMPEVTGWITGPGCVKTNNTPWAETQKQFEFVESFAGLRPKVHGAGNLGRFDYWLNTYRAAESIARTGCLVGELERAVTAMKAEKNAARRKELASGALAIRIAMARAWEKLMSYQTAATDTPGELGTLANFETQNRGTRRLLSGHDDEIAEALGSPWPAEAAPSKSYDGPRRLIVPTARGQLAPGEALSLKVIAIGPAPPGNAALHWRKLGPGAFASISLRHISRGVYAVDLPPAKDDFEYYIDAEWPGGEAVRWPPTAPRINQTVIVADVLSPH